MVFWALAKPVIGPRFGPVSPQGLAGEIDAVGIVHEAVQDGVGIGVAVRGARAPRSRTIQIISSLSLLHRPLIH